MRVLMAGGGTGGHIYPAIAIADTLKKRYRNSEIAFIATETGLENRLVSDAGYKIYHIEARGFKRSFSLSNLAALYYYFASPRKAAKLISEFKPDVCIGTGAYLSWPLLSAASRLGVPCAIHESNAVPGKAVSMLEGKVDRIYTNFPSTSSYLKYPEKALCVGNPLTGKEIPGDKAYCRRTLGIPSGISYVVLSFGGSLGASNLNDRIMRMWKDFTCKHPEIYHIHAAGISGYERTRALYEEYGLSGYKNLVLSDYFYDMALYEGCADAVICRAGAMTLSELASGGIPSILIPSPFVANDHQKKNAAELVKAKAAYIVEEKDFPSGMLEEYLSDILFNQRLRASLSENSRKFSRPNAANDIADDINSLVSREILSLIK